MKLRLQDILTGGDEVFKAIYREYRDGFIVWAGQHYSTQEADAVDVFQDAVIIFYKNVREKKIKSLEASIKTYIYGIGKNLLLKQLANKRRTVLVENMTDPLLKELDLTIQIDEGLSERQEMIRSVLKKLTEKCMQIIQMVYYRRFSMEAIKENMGYSSEEVARTSKKKCMRKLEALVKEQLAKNI